MEYTGKERETVTGEEKVVYRGNKVPAEGTRLPEEPVEETLPEEEVVPETETEEVPETPVEEETAPEEEVSVAPEEEMEYTGPMGTYKVTGEIEGINEDGTPNGEFLEIGSVHELPTEVGDNFVKDGVAEKMEESTPEAEVETPLEETVPEVPETVPEVPVVPEAPKKNKRGFFGR